MAEKPAARGPYVWPIRPGKMIWALILAAGIIGARSYGTPHIRYEYTWSGSRQYPRFHECYYAGLHSRRVYPLKGECPLILFLSKAEER